MKEVKIMGSDAPSVSELQLEHEANLPHTFKVSLTIREFYGEDSFETKDIAVDFLALSASGSMDSIDVPEELNPHLKNSSEKNLLELVHSILGALLPIPQQKHELTKIYMQDKPEIQKERYFYMTRIGRLEQGAQEIIKTAQENSKEAQEIIKKAQENSKEAQENMKEVKEIQKSLQEGMKKILNF